MQKPSDPRVYGSPLNQESVTRVTPEVLHQVAALSKLCTVSPASGSPSSGATSSGESGIIAAYSAETLANFCSLKGSRLIVWGTGNQARAAALYHLSIQHTPAWLIGLPASPSSAIRLVAALGLKLGERPAASATPHALTTRAKLEPLPGD